MTDDPGLAMAEISQAIATEILASPGLSEPDWQTYALVAEVSDGSVGLTGYRYPASGPPLATEEPEVFEQFWDLRDQAAAIGGTVFDVVLVKIRRETSTVVMHYVSGADADRWRINPTNLPRLPEALRPGPEDFEPIDGEAP